MLFWKKRAEEELQRSGLKYTIVRPGGLQDAPREGGKVRGESGRRTVTHYGVTALHGFSLISLWVPVLVAHNFTHLELQVAVKYPDLNRQAGCLYR